MKSARLLNVTALASAFMIPAVVTATMVPAERPMPTVVSDAKKCKLDVPTALRQTVVSAQSMAWA